jgi:hypothetical protein
MMYQGLAEFSKVAAVQNQRNSVTRYKVPPLGLQTFLDVITHSFIHSFLISKDERTLACSYKVLMDLIK